MNIIIDHATRRQFVRDFKLPIQIVQDGYFEYYLDLYQEHYGAREKYNLLVNTIAEFGSLEAFVEESRRIRTDAVDFVKKQPAYIKLESDRLDSFKAKFSQKINLYNHSNTEKQFVSIDMVKGNVQSFNFFDKDILQADTYDEFMSKFTKHDYFKQSKQIRQVIFGNLSPKKQQNIQKYIMSLVKDLLIENGVNEDDIFASSSDEIVVSGHLFETCEKVLKSENLKHFNFHLELFTLESLKENLPVFIKRFENKNGIDIKMGNAKYMAEIIKYIKDEPLHEYDLYFFDEGRIAKYVEPFILKEE